LSRWKHRQKAFKIFITPKYNMDKKYRWVDKRSCKEIEGKYYDKLNEIQNENLLHSHCFGIKNLNNI